MAALIEGDQADSSPLDPAVYHERMSRRDVRETPNAGTEEDVEPYFPEPLVELDLDTLD